MFRGFSCKRNRSSWILSVTRKWAGTEATEVHVVRMVVGQVEGRDGAGGGLW